MTNSEFKSISVVGKHQTEAQQGAMSDLLAHLVDKGHEVRAPEPVAGLSANSGVTACDDAALCSGSDLVIAIGGDGTMLNAAGLVAETGIPLLGINRGRLGFLADIGQAEMLPRVDEILAGKYIKDVRLFVEACLGQGNEEQRLMALNDVVLQRSETGRMVDLETHIDGRFVNTHAGDGLIIATATGSTAYAMSCGGPIIQPSLGALLLVPICPHTLSDRPIAVPASASIEVRLARSPGGLVQVFCDGRLLGTMDEGQSLSVTASEKKLTLIHPADHDYYRMLRSKLRWGDTSRDNQRGG